MNKKIEEEISGKRKISDHRKRRTLVHIQTDQARFRKEITKYKNEAWKRNCCNLNKYMEGRKTTESCRLIKNVCREKKNDIITS